MPIVKRKTRVLFIYGLRYRSARRFSAEVLILDSNVLIKLQSKRHQKEISDFLVTADEKLHSLAIYVPNIVRYEVLRNEQDLANIRKTILFLNKFHDYPLSNDSIKLASYYWKILDKHKRGNKCPNPT